MSARLVSLELENFRGFRDSQRLDLDADIILIRGDNGSGKTSLTDGILWLITGALPHLTDRVKGLRQTHDPIQNRYGEGPSRVALRVRTDAGAWLFERTGDARSTTLRTSRDGESLEGDQWLPQAFGEDSSDELRSAVSTWGILRQDAIRSVLDTGGAALHERMSSVIGLTDVTRFREACRTATKNLALEHRQSLASYTSAQSAAGSVRRDLNDHQRTTEGFSRSPLQARLNAAVAATTDDVTISFSQTDDLEGVVRLGQKVASLIELSTAAADAYDAYVLAADAVIQTSGALEVDFAAAQAQADELSRLTSDTQRLAEAALGLLGEQCPVCDQPIDTDLVRAKLQQDLERNTTRLIAATESRKAAASISQRLVEARAAEQGRAQVEEALARRTNELAVALNESSPIHVEDSMRRHEGLRALARRLEEVRFSLRRVHAEVQAELEAADTRLLVAVDVATAEETRARAALDLVTAREESAKDLEKATQIAADRIVARWLRDLEPSFAEVFDRLSPHPTFSVLRARQDVFYNRNQVVPEVVDPVRGITANPLLVYSEGQLNTVALSYFLGLALNAPSASLGFMVLDDPLQAMDVLAVLGFADLCRRLRQQRQLLITTHDRRYADLLARKLAPREALHTTITHEFENWSRTGPQVTTRRQEFVSTPAVLESETS